MKKWYKAQENFMELQKNCDELKSLICTNQIVDKENETCFESFHCSDTGKTFGVQLNANGTFVIYEHKIYVVDGPLEIKAYKFNMRDTDSVNIAVEFTKGKNSRTVTGHLNITTNMAHLSVDEDEVEKLLESWNIELDEIEKRIESRDIELI